MLTKEEYTKEDYLKAKEYLQMANDYPNSKYNDSRGIDIAISMFEQLIKEHFELVKNIMNFMNDTLKYLMMYMTIVMKHKV